MENHGTSRRNPYKTARRSLLDTLPEAKRSRLGTRGTRRQLDTNLIEPMSRFQEVPTSTRRSRASGPSWFGAS